MNLRFILKIALAEFNLPICLNTVDDDLLMLKEYKMNKTEMLENLEYALKSVLCKGLEGIDHIAMSSNVELFIREEVTTYSVEELVDKFYTPEMSINIFMEFIKKKGALEDPGENTIQ